ncbi:MAG: hypothetical protein HYR84_12630 [Planctomycetes bacterium]|nr:hypothetical protein [Planctomycetota bacterium]
MADSHQPVLAGFDSAGEGLIGFALDALNLGEYDTGLLQERIKADMPKGYRAMSLDDGAALGKEAFESPEWLLHVLEEELLHLMQKSQGLAEEFNRGTALELELDVNESRKFPAPGS